MDTPLGTMVAVSNDQALYLVEFVDNPKLQHKLRALERDTRQTISLGNSAPLNTIADEFECYFAHKLHRFATPIHLTGSLFQKQVWEQLKTIRHGETRSYSQIAQAIGNPSAFRAVAQANSANRLAIVVPCHRVINSNGTLGGYSGGLSRKKQLLAHESSHRFIE